MKRKLQLQENITLNVQLYYAITRDDNGIVQKKVWILQMQELH